MPPIEPIARGKTGSRRREKQPGSYGLVLEELAGPLTSRSLFGNERPLELEIGSGKGTFLVAESKARPDVNFLGLEYARRYWLAAADRLRRNECVNARVVLGEAERLVRDFLQAESLAGVHAYFPDPWPKTRHHKRRLFKLPFVELLASRMKPGATLQIATDHPEYYGEIVAVFEKSSLGPAPFGTTASAAPEELVGTNFERKYRAEGRRFFTLAVAKSL
jgi:tRNA (guanine-N7-)-methyltransferase